jgi:aspartate aminotransferase-like enzyme
MPGLLPNVDPDGLLEYSVVYTDRSLNHMSKKFQKVVQDITMVIKEVYNAHTCALVPGSGTFGMEAVARQFANNEKCLILRNGWFSYRWTQIFEMGNFAGELHVLKAQRQGSTKQSPFAPHPIEDVVALIKKEKPAVVFAPHVETSAGIILPDDYLKQVGQAVHSVGGIFVLDCVASGAMWVDMQACEVDIIISAPQKGWSSSPCCAMVAFSKLAREKMENTTSSSYANDLKKWTQIIEAYATTSFVYHTTLPTDALRILRDVMLETRAAGFAHLKAAQIEMGAKIRKLLIDHGFPSVAAQGYQAPCVIVSYTTDADVQSGKKFIELGLQTAAGVPLQCDEGPDYKSFRLGLFGLEKLQNVERSVRLFEEALVQIQPTAPVLSEAVNS